MEASRASDVGMEKLVRDLSSHLASTLGSLGYQRHGLDKDDLLQEIHIRIWKSLRDSNHNIQYFNAYLRKIVYSVFINEINRIKKENEVLETGGPRLIPYRGSNGCGTHGDVYLKNALVASIDGLKESKQRVMKLRLQGFTLDEIAQLNRWSYRKTCSLFYRGLKELKRKLQEKGIRYED
jgi:DNA-directed RNA polymerase specialized sigma24 family protein